MGAVKNLFKAVSRPVVGALKGTIGGLLGGFGGNDAPQAPVESEADKLAKEEAASLEVRRKAIAGLTQTSSLGAGSPQTSRKSVLGV